MIVLEDRLWSSFSCGSRMLIIPAGIIAFCLLTIGFARLKEAASRSLRGVQPRTNSDLTDSFLTHRATVVLGTTALLSVSFVASVSPNVTYIASDGSSIVENGCHATTTYTKEIRLDFSSAIYEHKTSRRRSRETHRLLVSDGRSTIILKLGGQKDYAILARIAPKPMAQYAKALRESSRPIPAPLLHLLQQSDG
nr:hypothetical protein [uncultured Shinella sp.]